jgi:hypothetical protein
MADAVQHCARYEPTTEYRCAECAGGYHALNASVCAVCPAGSRCVGGVRAACEAGSYQSASGRTACVLCPPGRAGGTEGRQACGACGGASFAAMAGQRTCTPMTAGFFGLTSAGVGVTTDSSSDGGAGGAEVAYVGQRVCPAGWFCVNGSRTACAAGSFQTATGATGCLACGAGMYTPTAGTVVACVRIPAGFYGTGGDATRRTGIAACGAGSACVNGTAMVCGAGTTQPQTGRSACLACPPGTFSDAIGRSTPCTPVQAGFYGASAVGPAGSASQIICPIGSFCTNGVARPCPAGQYQSATGATACLGCTFECPSGMRPTLVCDAVTGVDRCIGELQDSSVDSFLVWSPCPAHSSRTFFFFEYST